MSTDSRQLAEVPNVPKDPEEWSEPVDYRLGLSRRQFVSTLGAGLLLTVWTGPAIAQRRGPRGGPGRVRSIAARLHLGTDGTVTVLSGKVEMGQGARAELTQAAAEELRLVPEKVVMVLGDTGLVPDDGITAGSRTTPSTVPAVREAAAAARQLLLKWAGQQWGVSAEHLELRDGRIVHPPTGRSLAYGDLAKNSAALKALDGAIPPNVTVTPVSQWKVLGTSLVRPNLRDLVTGAHKFPSDLTRPEMLYGKVLRPPAYGARLVSIDLAPAKALGDVVVVRDGDLVGVAAPTTHRARQALEVLARAAVWDERAQPSSREIFEYLRREARGGIPKNPFSEVLAQARHVRRATYQVAYVQHAPLETRAALAEWKDGKLTVWAGTQNPFGYRSELARALGIPAEDVRVIVPDFGSGFGGKHTGEAAVEAARLARAAGRPVMVHWTRTEEFTWAYFRPAAVIDIEASLDAQGALSSWFFVNINSGPAAMETPYRTGKARSHFVPSQSPLRQGSYRALAATANNFAREAFMDELAAAAGADPLDFRLAHLDSPRLRAVLEEAAKRFGWAERVKRKQPDVGVGLACGTEKGSYVAACVEIAVDRSAGRIAVRRVCQVFECGAILNPDNLLSQVQGCILMGMGPALREEMVFDRGRIRNPGFERYRVPRFSDLPPEMDIHLLDRPDLPSAGGGETPIIAIAPAIANAVYHATGQRVRSMPIRIPPQK